MLETSDFYMELDGTTALLHHYQFQFTSNAGEPNMSAVGVESCANFLLIIIIVFQHTNLPETVGYPKHPLDPGRATARA